MIEHMDFKQILSEHAPRDSPYGPSTCYCDEGTLIEYREHIIEVLERARGAGDE